MVVWYGLCACLASLLIGQQGSLRDAVREKHEPVRRVNLSLVPRMELPELVRAADLVIHASIAAKRAYLSPDERWVLTDFALSPHAVLFDRADATRKVPGAAREYKMTAIGGDVVLESQHVSSYDKTIPALDVGDNVVVFLRRNEELQSWVPLSPPYALFRVTSAGKVEALKHSAPHNGDDVNALINAIRAELSKVTRVR